MNKEIENEIYDYSYQQFLFEVDSSHQRKALLTRILKLSSSESDTPYQLRGEELPLMSFTTGNLFHIHQIEI